MGTVFVAEDDEALQTALGTLLEDAGYEVRLAATGRDVLHLLAGASRGEHPMPDALILDAHMPMCGGLEVLTAIRLADWTQPVILLSGFADDDLRARAVMLGAAVSLDKPVEGDVLVDMIQVLVQRRRATDEVIASELGGERSTASSPALPNHRPTAPTRG